MGGSEDGKWRWQRERGREKKEDYPEEFRRCSLPVLLLPELVCHHGFQMAALHHLLIRIESPIAVHRLAKVCAGEEKDRTRILEGTSVRGRGGEAWLLAVIVEPSGENTETPSSKQRATRWWACARSRMLPEDMTRGKTDWTRLRALVGRPLADRRVRTNGDHDDRDQLTCTGGGWRGGRWRLPARHGQEEQEK